MKAPDEIEQAPCIAARRPERAAGGIDVDARRSLVGIGDLPGRKRSAKLGPDRFVNNPCAFDRRSGSGPCAQGDGFCRFSRDRGEFAPRHGIVETRATVDLSDLGHGIAVERTCRYRCKSTVVCDPGRERGIGGQRLLFTRNDMFGANFFQVEKRHEGTGSHPQEDLDTDEYRQPFVDLAAEHMQAQLQRRRCQPVLPLRKP